jgi:hypothetical protein
LSIKAALSKIFARRVRKKINNWSSNPIATQEKVLLHLINEGKKTAFGKDHHFNAISNYEEFKKHVPIRDYEALRPYVERIKNGEADVLWKGLPIYFCKTSGTTSGTKYIPITSDSISNHINSARNAILCYIAETGDASFVDGKMIFLQGSPELDTSGKIPVGRLSGIVAHHVPAYLQKNRMPSFAVNCIDDWEEKVDAIAKETLNKNMTLISGIPPWVQMYFDSILKHSGKANVNDVFPHFSLFIYGGVNFEPYRKKIEQTVGKRIPSIELYPASEGFIAYQDSQLEEGLLLALDDGIYYEFIPVEEVFDAAPRRLSLKDVELNKQYAVVINSNAGLWGYNIGDTIKFVNKAPFRIEVTGRIKHFISAFGEHVIGEEVEAAIQVVANHLKIEVSEFHVAPEVTPLNNDLPYHEWFIETEHPPTSWSAFQKLLDETMQSKNSYYKDLIVGKVLQPLKITPLPAGAFHVFMKSSGKLGGQNKLPRLSNDRKIANALSTANGQPPTPPPTPN